MVENTVIDFEYAGGSTPGKKRKVFVTEVHTYGFGGYDFTRGSFRNFRNSKASCITYDKAAKVVDVSTLPASIKVQDVVNGFKSDGYSEVYTEHQYVVAVKLPQTPRLEVTDTTLTFKGPNGYVVLNIAGGRLSVYENGRGINQQPDDPMPIYEAIKRVLGA